MFEYLMPALVLRTFPSTLLSQTHHGAVKRHIAYGAERGVPWGISESAYNVRDRRSTYQYRAFGVPDLALKRGLSRDLVVAPYATASGTYGRAASSDEQPGHPRSGRCARTLRLQGFDRLHTSASRVTQGIGRRVHGASRGNEHRCVRQRAQPQRVADAVSPPTRSYDRPS